jgi:hypothetical protein
MSRITTRIKLAMPQRNNPSEPRMSCAVLAASPGVTRAPTAPKVARTIINARVIPAVRLALRNDWVSWFMVVLLRFSVGVVAVM